MHKALFRMYDMILYAHVFVRFHTYLKAKWMSSYLFSGNRYLLFMWLFVAALSIGFSCLKRQLSTRSILPSKISLWTDTKGFFISLLGPHARSGIAALAASLSLA